MLEPVYLAQMGGAVTDLYSQLETDILTDMAQRINQFDMLIPSSQYSTQALAEMGALQDRVTSQLSAMTNRTATEIQTILEDAAITAWGADEALYTAAGIGGGGMSQGVLEVLQAGLTKTQGLFTNLTSTTASAVGTQFVQALDRAYLQTVSGAVSPTQAVTNAVKQLSAQGVSAITYPSGKVDSLEVATRRALITGVNQTCLQMQEARADELGVDLVEVSAHSGARPEHALWQGEIYSRSGKSKTYPSLVTVTGYGTGAGLGGWNCSHSFYPYIEGFPRAYDKEMLDHYTDQTYTYNGQAMTEYEALQVQRNIERNIRRWKKENMAMDAIGMDTTQSASKIAQWNSTQTDFLDQTGLKNQASRTQLAGWGKSQASKAATTARNVQAFEALSGLETSNGVVVAKTTHIIQQAEKRGVSANATKNALTNPLKITTIKIDEQNRPSQQFIGENATVAVNPENGNLITAWQTGSKLAKKLKEGSS